MPDFIKAYNANKDKFVVVGIDWNDELSEVQQHVKEFNIPFPITIDNTGDLIVLFHARGHPTNIFIDQQGVITSIVPGMVTPEFLNEQLGKLLK